MTPRRRLVLLIEDNDDDVALTARALKLVGVPVDLEVASDGAEALVRLCDSKAVPPDLILLDLKLPLVDGLDLLRRVRLDQRLGAVPVVVLTSSLEERDLRESYGRGANSYLRKPVDFDEFRALLRDLVHYWLDLNRTPRRRPEEGCGG